MSKRRSKSVSYLLVAVILFQVWSRCQARIKRTYSYESQYISTYMKVITSGAKVIINPVDKDVDNSDHSLTIYPYKIEEKSSNLLSLSTKEYSIKDAKTYGGVAADTATLYSNIQSGSIHITYTLLHADAKNHIQSTGDLLVDIKVKDWAFTSTPNTFLEISMMVEAKDGIFEKTTSNMFNKSIVQSNWNNAEIPVVLYSTGNCMLDGVKTEMQVTSVNMTSQQIKYTFHTPKFTDNSTYTAIWFSFPRAMPAHSAVETFCSFILILQATLCSLLSMKIIL